MLTDAESTPIARLDIDAVVPDEESGLVRLRGPVTALQPAEHGPFRRLRRTVAEVLAVVDGRPTVAVPDQPLQEAHLDAIRAVSGEHVVLLLPLVGDRSPVLLSPAALVRTSLAAAEALPGALVVPVPLARRADPADEFGPCGSVRRRWAGAASGDRASISRRNESTPDWSDVGCRFRIHVIDAATATTRIGTRR